MTIAAIDRLVHHATILEFGSESYRKRAATNRIQHPDNAPPTNIIPKRRATTQIATAP